MMDVPHRPEIPKRQERQHSDTRCAAACAGELQLHMLHAVTEERPTGKGTYAAQFPSRTPRAHVKKLVCVWSKGLACLEEARRGQGQCGTF